MKDVRNPFRLRASEQIESDSMFLRLFGPGALDLLPSEGAWDRIQIFRSAPGGGKTSFFRLFTPGPLLTLFDSRSNDEFKDLYARLRTLGIVSETGPQVLAVLLPCTRNYANLDDLTFDKAHRERLFYSLLNSRITLVTLRSALSLKRLAYPDDLSLLKITRPSGVDLPTTVSFPCSGVELYEWASSLEKAVCNAIDSFDVPERMALVGHETLSCASFLTPGCILFQGKPIADRSLMMLDDVHKLASGQRRNLLDVLFELKMPIGVWLAERLEALGPIDLLALGAREGREYGRVITLEEFWSGNGKRFETMIGNIANRRAKLNPEVQAGPFSSCLESSLEGPEWEARYSEMAKIVSHRLRDKWSRTTRYDLWMDNTDKSHDAPREKGTRWRTLEILIERDHANSQSRLFERRLPEEDLQTRLESSVEEAAELFISKEFKVPYYFGFPRLANLASSNIDQFLDMAGDLFEEIISASLVGEPTLLSPTRQEDILRTVASRHWKEITVSASNGRDVLRLLESIRQMAQWETEKENAPYAPGITGIAISMDDRDRLIDREVLSARPEYDRLARTISSCISNNLLEARLGKSQGEKGKTWMILYLNRILCLQFDLPLQYGGWRGKNLSQLCEYLDRGFKEPDK